MTHWVEFGWSALCKFGVLLFERDGNMNTPLIHIVVKAYGLQYMSALKCDTESPS